MSPNNPISGSVPATQVSRSKALLFTVRPEVFATAVVMGVLWVLPRRLLHVTLLAFNTVAVRILSILSGGKESVFAKKENSRAFIIVASQVS
ncbi:hypothetical protein KSP40_PGU015293 [Platanthera guangdongensis]|uniref:Uncharacterized protein n=1 Tax=Platanthera guangdongensis TaxID=2320717 RepID=A0ABR2MJE8_9ASPA